MYPGMYEAMKKKQLQLEREIGQVEDATLRANLIHTASKLAMFTSDVVESLQASVRNRDSRVESLELILFDSGDTYTASNRE